MTAPSGVPAPRTPGEPLAGRHREHLFPARTRRVAPSFSAEEYQAVVAAARRVGLTPTGFCARAALTLASGLVPTPGSATANQTTRPPVFLPDARLEALARLQAELAAARTAVVRVGTNLNQAARVLNATGEAPVWLRHVAEVCARAVAAVDAAASMVHRRL
jgi:hypothetical protein